VGKVYEAFSHLWKTESATDLPRFDEERQVEAQGRADSVRDMRVFISTSAYRDFRAWLDHEIDSTSPNPDMGSDVASCYTFKREGLVASRKRLDLMVRLAEEKLSDG
jgi:hypothetical protein